MRLSRLVRLGVGCLLVSVAIALVPICWVTAAVLHASACRVGLTAWTCTEPVGAFIVHQALVSLSPGAAVLLFAVGDALRRVR
jgi:hypothetical protein